MEWGHDYEWNRAIAMNRGHGRGSKVSSVPLI